MKRARFSGEWAGEVLVLVLQCAVLAMAGGIGGKLLRNSSVDI